MADPAKPVVPAQIRTFDELQVFLADQKLVEELKKSSPEQLALLQEAQKLLGGNKAFLKSLYSAPTEVDLKKLLGDKKLDTSNPAAQTEDCRTQYSDRLNTLLAHAADPNRTLPKTWGQTFTLSAASVVDNQYNSTFSNEMKALLISAKADFSSEQHLSERIDSRIRLLGKDLMDVSDAASKSRTGWTPELKTRFDSLWAIQKSIASDAGTYTPAQKTAMESIWNQMGQIKAWENGGNIDPLTPTQYAEISTDIIAELENDVLQLDKDLTDDSNRDWNSDNRIGKLNEIQARYEAVQRDKSLLSTENDGAQSQELGKLGIVLTHMQKWRNHQDNRTLHEVGILKDQTAAAATPDATGTDATADAGNAGAAPATSSAGGAVNPSAPLAGIAAPATGGTPAPSRPAPPLGDTLARGASGAMGAAGDLFDYLNNLTSTHTDGNDAIGQGFNGVGDWIGDFASGSINFLKNTFNGMSRGGKGVLAAVGGALALPWLLNNILPSIPGLGAIAKMPIIGSVISLLAVWFGARAAYKFAYENSSDPITTLGLSNSPHITLGWQDPDHAGQGGNGLAGTPSGQFVGVPSVAAFIPTQSHDGKTVGAAPAVADPDIDTSAVLPAAIADQANAYRDVGKNTFNISGQSANNGLGHLAMNTMVPSGLTSNIVIHADFVPQSTSANAEGSARILPFEYKQDEGAVYKAVRPARYSELALGA